MAEERTTLAQIKVKQAKSEKTFFIQTKAKANGSEGFHLILTDGTTAWEGTVSEDDIDELSSKRKMDFQSYVDQTMAAFTQSSMADMSFEFYLSVTGSSKEGQFVWKKHIVEEDIKFQLGAVKVKQSSNGAQTVCQVLSGCVETAQELDTQVKALQAAQERLSSDRHNALKRLEKCVKAKESLEKDLYSKFAAVLNSKKERIRQLEENGVPSTMDGKDDASTTTQPTTSRIQQGSDDVDTDEESPVKRQKTTPKKPAHLAAQPSLELGEGTPDTEERKAPATRRPRRPTRKETPSRPVLPRVTSGNSGPRRQGSASRPSSLRKSGSDNSNKSSENLDPDDLLDNF